MPTRIVQEPTNTTYVQGSAGGGMSIMLMTFVSLIVIAIAVLLILHFTTNIL